MMNVEFDSNAMDDALKKDGLDWTCEKPSHDEYTTIYIIKTEETKLRECWTYDMKRRKDKLERFKSVFKKNLINEEFMKKYECDQLTFEEWYDQNIIEEEEEEDEDDFVFERKIHPVAELFMKSLADNHQDYIVYCKDYELMLYNDFLKATPYSLGEATLAGWGFADDFARAIGKYEYEYDEDKEDEEDEIQVITRKDENGKIWLVAPENNKVYDRETWEEVGVWVYGKREIGGTIWSVDEGGKVVLNDKL
jgi:hypothetical protein